MIVLLLWSLASLAATDPATGWEGVAPPPPETRQLVEFERFNGLYSNPNPELEPVRQGPITIQLRSPENSVELFRHRLALTPLGDGTHRAQLVVDFQGEGKLEADISLAGAVTRLTDEVHLPRQQLEVIGRIRLERVAVGYRVFAVELPASVQVAIDSRLGGSLMTTCRSLTRFLPLVGCNDLEGALHRATVPLPPPGTELFLSDDLLTPENRAALDGLLGGA